MPLLIAFALVAMVFAAFPYTSLLSVASFFCIIVWCAQKGSKLKQLERQLYLDRVAAFRWHDDMNPLEFERHCAEAMRLAGWAAETTKGSGDQGVDVVAERARIRVVLQCKRYSTSVGNKAVQEAFAAKTFARAQHAAVVTNSQFTPAARALAASTGVLLLHFTDLARPNKLFGLPDTPSFYRPSDVTEAQIHTLRQSRIGLQYIFGFGAALVLTVVHDVSQLSVVTSPGPTSAEAASSATPAITAPETISATLVQKQTVPTPSPTSASSAAAVIRHSAATAAEARPKTALKTRAPAFLRDGNTFCATATDFDKRWRWMLSGDSAQEPFTPSCIVVFGQSRPLRVSVMQRLGSNKTMIRVEEGDLTGRVGYTDAFLP